MHFFRAPYDRLATIMTVVVLALFAGGVLLALSQPVPDSRLRYGLPVLLVLIPLLTYLFSPTGYSLGPDGLRIHRPIGALVVPLASLRSARQAEPKEMRGIRTFGSGGLFGFFGRFYSKSLGHYRAYVTNRHNLVLVEAERFYLLSPERPDDFLRHLTQWAPGLAGQRRD